MGIVKITIQGRRAWKMKPIFNKIGEAHKQGCRKILCYIKCLGIVIHIYDGISTDVYGFVTS